MSLYDCAGCDKYPYQHCNGSGSVSVFDTEDGPNTYSCQCYCATSARKRRDEDREIADLVKKYGRERVLAAIEAKP